MLIISDIHTFHLYIQTRTLVHVDKKIAYMLPTWCNLLIISSAVGM